MAPLFLILLILLGLALVAVWFLQKGGSTIPAPIPIGLVALSGVVLVASLIFGKPEPETLEDREMSIQSAVGTVLAREALKDIDAGQLLIVRHPHAAWADMGAAMEAGAAEVLGASSLFPKSISLEGYKSCEDVLPDISAIVAEMKQKTIPKCDGILFAFPMMGDLGGAWPRLPPLYGLYDGQSNSWKAHLKAGRFKAMVRPGIWATSTPVDDEALKKISYEYVLVTDDTVAEFADLP